MPSTPGAISTADTLFGIPPYVVPIASEEALVLAFQQSQMDASRDYILLLLNGFTNATINNQANDATQNVTSIPLTRSLVVSV